MDIGFLNEGNASFSEKPPDMSSKMRKRRTFEHVFYAFVAAPVFSATCIGDIHFLTHTSGTSGHNDNSVGKINCPSTACVMNKTVRGSPCRSGATPLA